MNHLALIQGRTSAANTHGGRRDFRNYELFINEVLIRIYWEDSAGTGYASGKYLDKLIATDVAKFELALGCKCVKGRVRDVK